MNSASWPIHAIPTCCARSWPGSQSSTAGPATSTASSEPWFAGLLDALLATRGDHVSGLLSVLYAGDEPVAAQFGLRTGNLLVGWFTAYDPRFRKYSPGLIHLKQMAEELAAAGIHAIDMGGGAKNYYKETLKTHDIFVAQGIVTGRSVLGAAHRVRNASTRWAARTVHQRPSLYHAADQILRRSGVSRRIYGRMLQVSTFRDRRFRPLRQPVHTSAGSVGRDTTNCSQVAFWTELKSR